MTIKRKEHFLTTIDNPWNPFTNFDDWLLYDQDNKYFTCSYLERIVQLNNPNKSTIKLDDDAWYEAMKEIVEFNPLLYTILDREEEIDSVYLIE